MKKKEGGLGQQRCVFQNAHPVGGKTRLPTVSRVASNYNTKIRPSRSSRDTFFLTSNAPRGIFFSSAGHFIANTSEARQKSKKKTVERR